MPIKTQGDLPVKEILERENIFVMDEKRAMHQDIRPIQILILNLILPQLPFFLSFLCIIFEGAGYGMIHFWSKI